MSVEALNSQSDSFQRLPDAVLVRILGRLLPKDLQKMCRVSGFFYDKIEELDEVLWRPHVIKARFFHDSIKLSTETWATLAKCRVIWEEGRLWKGRKLQRAPIISGIAKLNSMPCANRRFIVGCYAAKPVCSMLPDAEAPSSWLACTWFSHENAAATPTVTGVATTPAAAQPISSGSTHKVCYFRGMEGRSKRKQSSTSLHPPLVCLNLLQDDGQDYASSLELQQCDSFVPSIRSPIIGFRDSFGDRLYFWDSKTQKRTLGSIGFKGSQERYIAGRICGSYGLVVTAPAAASPSDSPEVGLSLYHLHSDSVDLAHVETAPALSKTGPATQSKTASGIQRKVVSEMRPKHPPNVHDPKSPELTPRMLWKHKSVAHSVDLNESAVVVLTLNHVAREGTRAPVSYLITLRNASDGSQLGVCSDVANGCALVVRVHLLRFAIMVEIQSTISNTSFLELRGYSLRKLERIWTHTISGNDIHSIRGISWDESRIVLNKASSAGPTTVMASTLAPTMEDDDEQRRKIAVLNTFSGEPTLYDVQSVSNGVDDAQKEGIWLLYEDLFVDQSGCQTLHDVMVWKRV